MAIHPTAIVASAAQLAGDVEIGPFTVIGPGVTIGEGTVVGPHCVIDGRTTIGARNQFFSGAQIGVLSQDKKHDPRLLGRAVIGDDNVFREHMSLSASTMSNEEDDHRMTSVGNGCMFMSCSHVAHDCHVGNGVIMANCVCLAGHVDVNDLAIMGGLAGVHQECVVGTMAFVGGMTRASRDVPPYMIVEGNPPRCAGPNTLGLRRNGMDEAARDRVKQLYKIMYRSDMNTSQALAEIERVVAPSDERDLFLQFFRNSVRGVIK